jgi:hypothetical protein
LVLLVKERNNKRDKIRILKTQRAKVRRVI